MSSLVAQPLFGGKRQVPEYYINVNTLIRMLRPTTTLRAIAEHLNAAGFGTPSGLKWNRSRVATYLRSTASN